MTTRVPVISLSQGEGTVINATVDSPDGMPDVSIAAFTFTWRLWHLLTGTVLEKTVGSGIALVSSGETGELKITIDPADAVLLIPLTYDHQLFMGSSLSAQKLMEGAIQISASSPSMGVQNET